MTGGATLRLALVSAAPTSALRAARFPVDEDLDPDGRRRAALAAQAVAGGVLPGRARVLTDGSARARQTAQALALPGADPPADVDGSGTVPAAGIEAALRDLDVGDWRGRGLDEVPLDSLRRWHEDPAMTPPGGESRLDLLDRVGGWLARLGGEPGNVTAGNVTAGNVITGNVIAVTHPAVVRAALLLVLRCPPEVFWRIDVAPLTATLLHRRVPAEPAAGWTLTQACRPL
ncbi:histidine phosphatase family protein [Frankia sp. ACN1ag]|uniref:histidine phosphatase family protein n=1 Tax=Frankia sp. ACN1ag TaxID=102891 RepID=UPI0006DBE3B8|nr:histidine phosphatase family protein [Frankia sp. ACN1ag]